MPEATVKDLEDTNPVKAPKMRMREKRTSWLAYNRRADIILMPSGKKSAQFYPNGADDVGLIWQLPKPSLKKVEADQ